MDKETYIKRVNRLIAWKEMENKLYEASNGTISLFENESFAWFEDSYREMLEEATNDENDSEFDSMLDHFIYELDCGRAWEPGCVTLADGSDCELSSVEKLADYVYEHIKDKKMVEEE